VPKTLATKSSVWSAVFRRIVLQVTTNAPVLRIVSADRIRSWAGSPTDGQPLKPAEGRPMVRLTPSPRGVDWYSPDMQKGWLDVVVEVAVQTYCVDDPIDLWDLVVDALKPGALDTKGNGFALDLVALGAETGEIVFADPVVDTGIGSEPANIMVATGKFTLAVLRTTF
jgi:hypothetical protein